MADPERRGPFSREFLSDPFNLANLRHTASLDVQFNPASASYWVHRGILSPTETRLCIDSGLVIPSPFIPPPNTNYRDTSIMDRLKLVDFKTFPHTVDELLSANIPVYLVDGVFELVHGGHMALLDKTIKIAQEKVPIPGRVLLILQSNAYIEKVKKRVPIFPESVRAGWFRDMNIYKTVIWPTYEERASFRESWSSGLTHLDLMISARENISRLTQNQGRRELINFIYESPLESGMPQKEFRAVLKRIFQVRQHGFNVTLVDSHISDISTTKLLRRFDVKPSKEFYPEL